jgi:hypothetical protein
LSKEEYRQQVEKINKIHDLEVKEVNRKRHRVINELIQVHKKRMHGLDRERKEQGFLYTKSVLDLSKLQGTDEKYDAARASLVHASRPGDRHRSGGESETGAHTASGDLHGSAGDISHATDSGTFGHAQQGGHAGRVQLGRGTHPRPSQEVELRGTCEGGRGS